MPGGGQEDHFSRILSNTRLSTAEELDAIAKEDAELKKARGVFRKLQTRENPSDFPYPVSPLSGQALQESAEIECAKNAENQRLYYAARERDQIERQEEKRFWSDFEKYLGFGNNEEEARLIAIKEVEARKHDRKISKEQALSLKVENAQQFWKSKLDKYRTSLEEQLPCEKYDFHKGLETTILEKLEQEYLLQKEEIYRVHLEKKLRLYKERIAYLEVEENANPNYYFLTEVFRELSKIND